MEQIKEIILGASALIGGLAVIGGALFGVIKWFLTQEKQTKDIKEVRCLHEADMATLNEELCMLSYAMLAALDGLKQQGCNGEVTKAHEKLEKHINKKAHGQTGR